MRRFLIVAIVLTALISCAKNEIRQPPPAVIPNVITGPINEFYVVPLNITTPDKGFLLISANNITYKVDFNATELAQSNAILSFSSDTILTDDSREFTNLGKDVIAYTPVRANQITISFTDGRKVSGDYGPFSSFGGEFGEQLIAQWRDPADPTKSTQKAKDNIINFVKRYHDKDGPGPGTTPVYLLVTVSQL